MAAITEIPEDAQIKPARFNVPLAPGQFIAYGGGRDLRLGVVRTPAYYDPEQDKHKQLMIYTIWDSGRYTRASACAYPSDVLVLNEGYLRSLPQKFQKAVATCRRLARQYNSPS